MVPLAGIEPAQEKLEIKDFFRTAQAVLTPLLTRFLVPSRGWFGS